MYPSYLSSDRPDYLTGAYGAYGQDEPVAPVVPAQDKATSTRPRIGERLTRVREDLTSASGFMDDLNALLPKIGKYKSQLSAAEYAKVKSLCSAFPAGPLQLKKRKERKKCLEQAVATVLAERNAAIPKWVEQLAEVERAAAARREAEVVAYTPAIGSSTGPGVYIPDTAQTGKTGEGEESNTMWYVAGGIALVAAIGAGIYFTKKKKR